MPHADPYARLLEFHKLNQDALAEITAGIEEAERRRIGLELHDDTIQVMTAAGLRLDHISFLIRSGKIEQADQMVQRTLTEVRSAIERTRQLMFELAPQALDEYGLTRVLEDLAKVACQELGAQRRGRIETMPRMIPTDEVLIYRTFREALLNARKHSGARTLTVSIHLAGDETIEGLVSDDGRGFDPGQWAEAAGMAKHLGLHAAMQRVILAGGSGKISSGTDHGCKVAFSLPFAPRVSDALLVRPANIGRHHEAVAHVSRLERFLAAATLGQGIQVAWENLGGTTF